MHHVFVDCENVHAVDLLAVGKSSSFTLLLGARQTKLDADLVTKLMEHAASVQLVRLTTSGKNALDFTLAYYVGRAVITDPTGHFHIISKDTGFNPLIEHLHSRHIHAYRHNDFTTLTFSEPPKPASSSPDDSLDRVLAHLRKNVRNRPKSRKTLASHLLAFLGKTATETRVLNAIEKLQLAGQISISDKDAVTYNIGMATLLGLLGAL